LAWPAQFSVDSLESVVGETPPSFDDAIMAAHRAKPDGRACVVRSSLREDRHRSFLPLCKNAFRDKIRCHFAALHNLEMLAEDRKDKV
jgi:hypothetical protein